MSIDFKDLISYFLYCICNKFLMIVTNSSNTPTMNRREKTEKKINKLENQIKDFKSEFQAFQNTISPNIPKKESSIKKALLYSVGPLIAIIGLFITYKQIEISSTQNELVQSQLDLSKQQTEFQELEIYKSFLALDQNNQNKVASFIAYINLLDSETADKLLYKFSDLGSINLSLSSLKAYYERLHERKKEGLSGNELADFVSKLNSKIGIKEYCSVCFNKKILSMIKFILDVKKTFNIDDYRAYAIALRKTPPFELLNKIQRLGLSSYDLKINKFSHPNIGIFENLAIKIIAFPYDSFNDIVDDSDFSVDLLNTHHELIKLFLKKDSVLVGLGEEIRFKNSLDTYLETFEISNTVESLKSNINLLSQITDENEGWDCSFQGNEFFDQFSKNKDTIENNEFRWNHKISEYFAIQEIKRKRKNKIKESNFKWLKKWFSTDIKPNS